MDYTKSIEIDPNNGDVYYNRGDARHEVGDYQGAIIDNTKTIESDSWMMMLTSIEVSLRMN